VLNRIAWANPLDMQALKDQMQDLPHRFDRFGHEIMNVLQKER